MSAAGQCARWWRRAGAAPVALILGLPMRPAPPVTPPGGAADTAIVDRAYAGREGEGVAGIARYRTIGAALRGAPADTAHRYVIRIRPGRYREKLTVDRPNVTLAGESRDGTVLTYDAAADTPAPGGGTYGTRGSFTLRVTAPGFRAERLTIENAFDYAANARKAPDDPTRLRNVQAVAVMTDGRSDRAVFVDCRIVGNQDTLFVNAGRQYFRRCTIVGSVDFIFGAGVAVFEESDIISRDRGVIPNGYIVAPSTPLASPFGFLFVRSRLLGESPTLAPGSVLLGRPWHPGARPGVNSMAVFIDCYMGAHIASAGWTRMAARDAAGRQSWYDPADSRFFEYGSTGPGAARSPTRRVLTPTEARAYTVEAVLGGWRPVEHRQD